jgi:adenylate cyclase
MSQAVTAPAPSAAAPKKKQGLRVSISFRFAFFTVLLITAVMSAVGYSLFVQQRRTLSREVLGRGQTIAENLAASAREVMLQSDLLNLSILSKKAIQQGEVPFQESQYDLANSAHLIAGLTQAFQDLYVEVPVVLARTLRQASGQAALEKAMGADQRTTGIENEGIFEAIIVDNHGMVASHYKGTEEVNKPFKVPDFIVPATADTPFPIYEQELFQNGKRMTRRLFMIKQPMVIQLDGQPKDLGSVYLGMSEDLIARVVFQVTMKLAAIAIVAIAVGLLLTLVTVAWLTRPIGKLVSGVAAIAGGDFDTRLPVSSGDELGELTQAFNNMAVSLGQNAMLKGAFTRYVSDAALQQILSDPSKTGLHSQRVLATIYTSDMREFTSMSESLEPEQVVQVINTYLSLQTEIILKNRGVVDNFQGDATIGVWGKETPAADDALWAVRAGMEVQASINKLNEERKARGEVPKLFGLGINTGEVVSGNMGSSKKMKNTVIGEHVIFADKICNGCPGGQVWISESTYELVKGHIIAEPTVLGPKSENYEGVKVYQVNGFK